jgi:membrane-associated protease RseP (regulator of RpoE activity)
VDRPTPSLPDLDAPSTLPAAFGPDDVWTPPVVAPPRAERKWKYVLLLAATFLTTTSVGVQHYASWGLDFTNIPDDFSLPLLAIEGLWYSLSVLAILGAHEMGHYLMCVRYGVDASLPYFLPAPFLTGTLGAFIRIRQPIPTKRALFDIGIAGPIAGFVVAIPVLWIGLRLSHVVEVPPDFQGLELGEPLLFKAIAWLEWGSIPDGETINLHPMAFAAWFGLLATALNLFPVAQLDGGHVAYAVFGAKSRWITLATTAVILALTLVSVSWITWAVLVVVVLVVAGPSHPPTANDLVPLGRRRIALAAAAALVFALCFTAAPIEPVDRPGRVTEPAAPR